MGAPKSAVYILLRRKYSEKAGKVHGYPYVWEPIYVQRLPPPQAPEEFFRWMWSILDSLGYGEGWYRLLRTSGKGESTGWKGVAIFYITKNSIYIKKKYSKHKGIPGIKKEFDLFFKASDSSKKETFSRIHLSVL